MIDQPYINRELSLLAFNRRVMAQAYDESLPLLERLKFLTISSSNMDEFMEVRLAALTELGTDPLARTFPDGLRPSDAISQIHQQAQLLVAEQYDILNNILLPQLKEKGLVFLRRADWTEAQKNWVNDYFRDYLEPVLTPISLDPSHPFPRIQNKSLHFMIDVDGEDAFGRQGGFAILEIHRSLPRILKVPSEIAEGKDAFVFLSSIIHDQVGDLFPGMKVRSCHQVRITRNSNLFVDEEEMKDLMAALQGELTDRDFGEFIRLEVSDVCPENMIAYLRQKTGLPPEAVYQVNGPVNLHRLSQVAALAQRPDLEFSPHHPKCVFETTASKPDHFLRRLVVRKRTQNPNANIFDRIKEGDILLHHPYTSFKPIIDFVQQAAKDPDVLAIRMTLYRTNENSAIVDALIAAARADKEVTVVVELRARFDEGNNIRSANRLQEAGAHVVYGVVGYKTHAKMIHVVRREPSGLRHYVHLGTGNYHAITSRFYTDFGLLTANQEYGRDVYRIFQQITAQGTQVKMEKLLYAPISLHQGLLAKIEREITNAQNDKPSRIIAKMNGLHEKEMIDALYRASQAGVQIDLIIRGICCLRPGIEGLSENIRVRSIVGRFLEHHRIFYFENGGNSELFASSADWMRRNLLGRVETAFPIPSGLKNRALEEGLLMYLRDNTQAWLLQPDGTYVRAQPQDNDAPFSAQQALMERYSS